MHNDRIETHPRTDDVGPRAQLTPADRSRVAPLFASVPYWRAFIESATEREIGTLSVDNPSAPEVAVLFYGGLVVYGGRPDRPASESAVRLHDVQPLALVADEWQPLFRRWRAGRFRETTRYHLSSESIDPGKLRDAIGVHTGRVRPATQEMLQEIEARLGWEHHKYHYDGVEHFLANGHGFVAIDHDRIVAGASSFAISRNFSECQVTTVADYRRRGYGRAVAAHYVHSCRKADLHAPWDASNRESVQLALSLGYGDVQEYTVFEQV